MISIHSRAHLERLGAALDETEKKSKTKEKAVRLLEFSKLIETSQMCSEIATNAEQDALFRDAAISCKIPTSYRW